jgi:hypothetical protein
MKKMQYSAPKLVVFGSVAKLTTSGTGGNKENTGNTNQWIRRP